MPLRALIFDFDGLLVDTESPSYEAWREPFTERGVDLAMDRWLQVVGTHDADFDPLAELERLTGEAVDDRDELEAGIRERFEQLAHDEPCRPGVLDLLDAASEAGLTLAVASSSRSRWVESHLERLDLRDRFAAVVGRDLAGWNAKPAPDVYLEALRRIDVSARDALALEDSAHGVASALAAGLSVVAIPNPVTRHLAFDAKVTVVEGFDSLTLDDLQTHHRAGRAT